MKRTDDDTGYALAVIAFLALWFFSMAVIDYFERRIPNTPPQVVKARTNV